MQNSTPLEQAILAWLKATIAQSNDSESSILHLLLCLTPNSESDRWREAGDVFLKYAEQATSEGDKNCLIDRGFYCLRIAVDRARDERRRGIRR